MWAVIVLVVLRATAADWVGWSLLSNENIRAKTYTYTLTHTLRALSPIAGLLIFPSRLDRQTYTHTYILLSRKMGRLGGSESSCPWNQTESANTRQHFCFWGQKKKKKMQRESSCRRFHQRVIRALQLKVFGRHILYACCYRPSWDGRGIWDCKSYFLLTWNAKLWIYSGSEGVPMHLRGLIMVKSL